LKQEAASRADGPAAASSAAAADSGAATLRVYRGTPPAWSKPAHAQPAALLVTNSGRQTNGPPARQARACPLLRLPEVCEAMTPPGAPLVRPALPALESLHDRAWEDNLPGHRAPALSSSTCSQRTSDRPLCAPAWRRNADVAPAALHGPAAGLAGSSGMQGSGTCCEARRTTVAGLRVAGEQRPQERVQDGQARRGDTRTGVQVSLSCVAAARHAPAHSAR